MVATRLRIERDIVGRRRARRASRRSTLHDREKNSTIWSAALDELDELAELDDQKRLLLMVTIMNWYPLPQMNELCNRVRGAKIFTKLDLNSAYNLIQIKVGDEWKTAFQTRYGLFEYKVIPFGLANAPATFQNMMNEIFRDMIDLGVVIYLYDILIYSENEQDHVALVKRVLVRLQAHQLAIVPDKCEWYRSRVNLLGYIISPEGVEMDQ